VIGARSVTSFVRYSNHADTRPIPSDAWPLYASVDPLRGSVPLAAKDTRLVDLRQETHRGIPVAPRVQLPITLSVAAAVAVVAMLLAPSARAGEDPVPRLVYGKAVAYWKSEAKAHKVRIACEPWSPSGLTGRYECRFGGKYRVRLLYGGRCRVWAALYRIVPGGTVGDRVGEDELLALCRPGWQRSLPTPWSD